MLSKRAADFRRSLNMNFPIIEDEGENVKCFKQTSLNSFQLKFCLELLLACLEKSVIVMHRTLKTVWRQSSSFLHQGPASHPPTFPLPHSPSLPTSFLFLYPLSALGLHFICLCWGNYYLQAFLGGVEIGRKDRGRKKNFQLQLNKKTLLCAYLFWNLRKFNC